MSQLIIRVVSDNPNPIFVFVYLEKETPTGDFFWYKQLLTNDKWGETYTNYTKILYAARKSDNENEKPFWQRLFSKSADNVRIP